MAKVIFEVNELQNNDLIGRVVISKAGRDKESMYIVIGTMDEDHLLIANGSARKIELPKKKKLKHVILTDKVNEDIKASLISKDKNTNLKIKKYIKLNGTVKEV